MDIASSNSSKCAVCGKGQGRKTGTYGILVRHHMVILQTFFPLSFFFTYHLDYSKLIYLYTYDGQSITYYYQFSLTIYYLSINHLSSVTQPITYIIIYKTSPQEWVLSIKIQIVSFGHKHHYQLSHLLFFFFFPFQGNRGTERSRPWLPSPLVLHSTCKLTALPLKLASPLYPLLKIMMGILLLVTLITGLNIRFLHYVN